MLHYLYGDQLDQHPTLRDTMFRDRAKQFHERLKWEAVTVDENGFERDEYDDLNPLYVIWEREDGTHGGSMRLLPTTGRTMLAEHFAHLADVSTIRSPLVWEITRLCLAPGAEPGIMAALVLALDELMSDMGLDQMIAVFEASRLRAFRRMGCEPDVLGRDGEGRAMIAVGLWDRGSYDEADRVQVASRSALGAPVPGGWTPAMPSIAAHVRAPEVKAPPAAPAEAPLALAA